MAMQAYYDTCAPQRQPPGQPQQMYRGARYGDLLHAFVLDTRQYRDDQLYGDTRAPARPKPLPSAASWARRRNAGSTMAWPPPTRGGT
jgi:phosphodiesterase/alkaline phosphatase D-like protein